MSVYGRFVTDADWVADRDISSLTRSYRLHVEDLAIECGQIPSKTQGARQAVSLVRKAVLVTFEVKDGRMAEFLEIILAHAAGTLDEEPGCEQFQVLTPADGGNRVHLHEIYANETAFRIHRSSQRLSDVRLCYKNLITGYSLHICELQDLPDR